MSEKKSGMKFNICLWTVIILMVIAVSIYFFVFRTGSFYTNDEILMKSIASGEYTGTPNGHLVYIMSLLGWSFAVLYRLFPKVEWYDLFMIGMRVLSWGMISFGISRFSKKKYGKLLLAVLSFFAFVAIDASKLQYSQYTELSAVLFAVALVFYVAATCIGDKTDYVSFAIFILFSLLSLLVRKQVFFMGVPILFLSVLYSFIKKKKALIKEAWIPFAVFVGVIGFAFVFEAINYSSYEWKEYLEFNDNWAQIQDYSGVPVFELAKDTYEKNGMSENDYKILAMQNISFLEQYDTDAARDLMIAGEALNKEGGSVSPIEKIKSLVSALVKLLNNQRREAVGLCTIFVFLLTLIYALTCRKMLPLFASIICFSYQCVFSLLFIYLNRFPERVYYGLYVTGFIFMAVVFLCEYQENTDKDKKKAIAGILFAIALFAISIRGFGIQNYRILVNSERFNKYMEEEKTLSLYFENHPDNIYYVSSDIANTGARAVFSDDRDHTHNSLYLSHWINGSPVYDTNLIVRGISAVANDLCAKENFFIIMREGTKTEWLYEYYLERGINVSVECVDVISGAEGNNLVYRVTDLDVTGIDRLKNLGFNVDEVNIDVDGLDRSYRIMFVNDLHLQVDNDEIATEYQEFMKDRIVGFSSISTTTLGKWEQLQNILNSCGQDITCFGGDIVDFCSNGNTDALKAGFEKLEAPFIYVRSDHDTEPYWLANQDKENCVGLQNALCDNRDILFCDLGEIQVMGINNSNKQISDEALARVTEILSSKKPTVVVTHIPFGQKEGEALKEASEGFRDGRRLYWAGDAECVPDENTLKLMELLYCKESNVIAVLAAHLHTAWDGELCEGTIEHVFAPVYMGNIGVVSIY